MEWKTYRARVPDAAGWRLRGRRGSCSDGARGCPTPSQPRPRRSTINRKISTTRRSSPGRPRRLRRGTRRTRGEEDDEDDEEEAPDPVAAEEKFVEVLRERAPPARVPARVVQTRSPAPMPELRVHRRRRRRPAPRRAGPAHAPAGDSRALQPHTPAPPPGLLRAVRLRADVLDLNSASDDLLSQHPWGDDGGDGWADAMGTPDFQKKENKLGSPSKLPVARRAAGARRVSAPLVQTTSPNVAYAPGVNPNPKPYGDAAEREVAAGSAG